MRGDQQKVIVEEFIKFDLEITLLTIRQRKGPRFSSIPLAIGRTRRLYGVVDARAHLGRRSSSARSRWPQR